MNYFRMLFALAKPAETAILLRVLPVNRGSFGVFANTVLIASHADKSAAEAHCQRLRRQQMASEPTS